MRSVITAAMAIKSSLAEVVALVCNNDQRSAKTQYGGPQATVGGGPTSPMSITPLGLTSQGALYGLMCRRWRSPGQAEADGRGRRRPASMGDHKSHAR